MVRYYLSAENDEGDSGVSPRGAPDVCHLFRVDADFSDALESDAAWSVGWPGDDPATGIWTRADPVGTVYNTMVVQPEDDHTPDPGVACFVTGNGEIGGAAGENDVDRGRVTLLTPVFDLSGGRDIHIGYWRWYTNDRGYNPGEDYWRVDVSNDGGTSWTSVENTDVSSNAWLEVTFDLAEYFPVPGRVQLRFIAEDIGGGSLVEAAVDDFVLTGEFDDPTGVGDGTQGLTGPALLARNQPNPFSPATRIVFNLERPGPVSLLVYDLRGRLVDVLVDGWMRQGAHGLTWDGTDLQGRAASPGIYFYVLESEGVRLTRRMALVR